MKRIYALLAAILLVVLMLSGNAMNHLLTTYAPGAGPVGLFLDAPLLIKLMMIVCNLLLVVGVLGGLVGLFLAAVSASGAAKVVERLVAATGLIAALFGGLAGGYGGMITRRVIADTKTTDIAVFAPSYAEALLAVAIGSMAGLSLIIVALLIAFLREARSLKPA